MLPILELHLVLLGATKPPVILAQSLTSPSCVLKDEQPLSRAFTLLRRLPSSRLHLLREPFRSPSDSIVLPSSQVPLLLVLFLHLPQLDCSPDRELFGRGSHAQMLVPALLRAFNSICPHSNENRFFLAFVQSSCFPRNGTTCLRCPVTSP